MAGDKLKPKKKQQKIPGKSPDFNLEDIINAPKPIADVKPDTGSGCTHCGSRKFISKGGVKVFRGQRMNTYHCYDCGRDFYKGE
jgi:DNA-directed RNA polymerase subunit RPC12/RpoP